MAYQSSRDTRDDLLARIREWAQAKDEVQAWGRVLTALDAHTNAVLDTVVEAMGYNDTVSRVVWRCRP